MNQYEGMFLFDPTFGAAFENCEGEIRRILDRAGAEVVFCRKWDERRLAYKIEGRKRGVYVLVYFKAPTAKVAGIERDAQLSENILRLLVLRAEGVTREMMEASMDTQRREMDGEIDREHERDREGGYDDRGRGRHRDRGDRGHRGSAMADAVPNLDAPR